MYYSPYFMVTYCNRIFKCILVILYFYAGLNFSRFPYMLSAFGCRLCAPCSPVHVFQCTGGGTCNNEIPQGSAEVQTRLVECRNNTSPIDPALCPPHRKPRSRRKCRRNGRRRAKCPRWVTTKWSQVPWRIFLFDFLYLYFVALLCSFTWCL